MARPKKGREEEREVYLSRDMSRLLRCYRCKSYLPSSEFYMNSGKKYRSRDYARYDCKTCHLRSVKKRNARLSLQTCVIVGCDKSVDSVQNGMPVCTGHATRYKKLGDTFPEIPLGHKLPDLWEDRESCVYVAYGKDGAPLYVGSAFGEGQARWNWHERNQPWSHEIARWEVVSRHPNRGSAYEAEERLIKELCSRYDLRNKVHNNLTDDTD